MKSHTWLVACLMLAGGSAMADNDGARLFEPCRACHSLDPTERGLPGPSLAGLLGRKVGSASGFDYSPALQKARDDGLIWDEASLERFLVDPAEMFPGLWMSMGGIADPADRRALTRFLSDPSLR